jgi:hypothetical protein
MKPNALVIFAFGALQIFSTSCSVLVGNIKPIAEHSESYQIKDLASENSKEWMKLPSSSNDPDTATSDASYQSKQTASIISVNSACRPSNEENDRDLRYFTNLLLLGVTDITYKNEAQLQLPQAPALETTIQGKLSNEITKMRTVVIKMGQCVYDLMYISRPQHFQKNEKDFAQFVQSLRIK